MRYYVLSFFMMVCIILAGVWTNPEPMSTKGLNNQLELSPADVFEGETVKLRPHLGLTTGAVRVKYNGSKEFISTSYEIWEKGKLMDRKPSMSASIKSPFHGEISISIQDASLDIKNSKYKATTVISSETGYSSSTFFINKFDPLLTGGYGPRNWDTTQVVSDDQETAVWGFFVSDTFDHSESLELQAKKADWAFLLKVKMEEELSVGNR